MAGNVYESFVDLLLESTGVKRLVANQQINRSTNKSINGYFPISLISFLSRVSAMKAYTNKDRKIAAVM